MSRSVTLPAVASSPSTSNLLDCQAAHVLTPLITDTLWLRFLMDAPEERKATVKSSTSLSYATTENEVRRFSVSLHIRHASVRAVEFTSQLQHSLHWQRKASKSRTISICGATPSSRRCPTPSPEVAGCRDAPRGGRETEFGGEADSEGVERATPKARAIYTQD